MHLAAGTGASCVEEYDALSGLRSFEELGKAEKLEMVCEDLKAENSEKEERVKPTADPNITLADGKAETVLKKASWNVIRIHK